MLQLVIAGAAARGQAKHKLEFVELPEALVLAFGQYSDLCSEVMGYFGIRCRQAVVAVGQKWREGFVGWDTLALTDMVYGGVGLLVL